MSPAVSGPGAIRRLSCRSSGCESSGAPKRSSFNRLLAAGFEVKETEKRRPSSHRKAQHLESTLAEWSEVGGDAEISDSCEMTAPVASSDIIDELRAKIGDAFNGSLSSGELVAAIRFLTREQSSSIIEQAGLSHRREMPAPVASPDITDELCVKIGDAFNRSLSSGELVAAIRSLAEEQSSSITEQAGLTDQLWMPALVASPDTIGELPAKIGNALTESLSSGEIVIAIRSIIEEQESYDAGRIRNDKSQPTETSLGTAASNKLSSSQSCSPGVDLSSSIAVTEREPSILLSDGALSTATPLEKAITFSSAAAPDGEFPELATPSTRGRKRRAVKNFFRRGMSCRGMRCFV